MVKTMHISVTLSVLVHMAGVFHVVALSIIRYCSLSRLSNINSSQQWFTYQKCRISLVIIFTTVAIIGIPLHFTSKVVMVDENEGCAVRHPSLRNATAFQLQFSSFPYLQTLNFWLFNLCSKIIPSIILCIMTFLIINELKQLQQLSARFMNVKRDKQYQRTTKMILGKDTVRILGSQTCPLVYLLINPQSKNNEKMREMREKFTTTSYTANLFHMDYW
ncbi:hypothetical protein DICVIV_04424 [Dictyocaulus viviparus]|uniref:G-protein coupled receptors family 1 profile domain-containing protein n=1 Tax=Dictyocaulus viviparus TaxID=29172 RepID=A0A0D8Y055_DICVI|nr:hypothetical protein DICVIV_04424 [Dictyocaulus viviparus]